MRWVEERGGPLTAHNFGREGEAQIGGLGEHSDFAFHDGWEREEDTIIRGQGVGGAFDGGFATQPSARLSLPLALEKKGVGLLSEGNGAIEEELIIGTQEKVGGAG